MGFFKKITSTVKNIGKNPIRGLTAVGTMGLSEKIRSIAGTRNAGLMDMGDKLYTAGSVAALGAGGMAMMGGMGAGAAGIGGAGGMGGAMGGSGAAGVMAQSGGVPLLTKVLMGASVASTVAQYFGKKPGQDWNQFMDSVDDESRAEIQKLEQNLAELQKNVEVRDQAVSKIVNDFPNIAKQAIDDRKRSREAYGEEMDKVSSMMLDKASNELASKYAASGGFNSGAFNEALGGAATDIAIEKARPMAAMAREDILAEDQDNRLGMQLRLAEAEGLRDFQRTMLGQGMNERFSATQAMLQNGQANARFGAQMNYQQQRDRQTDNQQLFGSLGNTMGTMAMMPMYQQMFGGNRAATATPTNSMNNVPTGAPMARMNRPSYGSRLNMGGGY